jgi:predicted dienelactone hydrolase
MFHRSLPTPDGPSCVGSIEHTLTDSNRNISLTCDRLGRELFVKVWYPAGSEFCTPKNREYLWEQLRSTPSIPAPMKLLLGLLGKIPTNTYRNASFNTIISQPNILIYNHGLVSFAAESTLLMEHLASHGFIVVSIQHREQLAEFQSLQQRQPTEQHKTHALMQKQNLIGIGLHFVYQLFGLG